MAEFDTRDKIFAVGGVLLLMFMLGYYLGQESTPLQPQTYTEMPKPQITNWTVQEKESLLNRLNITESNMDLLIQQYLQDRQEIGQALQDHELRIKVLEAVR